jgi:hypothetical protein
MNHDDVRGLGDGGDAVIRRVGRGLQRRRRAIARRRREPVAEVVIAPAGRFAGVRCPSGHRFAVAVDRHRRGIPAARTQRTNGQGTVNRYRVQSCPPINSFAISLDGLMLKLPSRAAVIAIVLPRTEQMDGVSIRQPFEAVEDCLPQAA